MTSPSNTATKIESAKKLNGNIDILSSNISSRENTFMGPSPSVEVVTLTNDLKSLNGGGGVSGGGCVSVSENILNQDVIPSQTTLVSGKTSCIHYGIYFI